jgi:aconitate hydratase
VKANYLASPPLVVAYALAGDMDVDLNKDPIGNDKTGAPVYLKDIWPSNEEVQAAIRESIDEKMFLAEYGRIFEGDEAWQSLPVPEGNTYEWNPDSTYVKHPPFFQGMSTKPNVLSDVKSANVLALLGNTITTDHISPAGAIPKESPTTKYLLDRGVEHKDFNSYGSRRGNHEIMMRGTFGNIRLRNQLAPGTEGGWTIHLPSGEQMSIYDAAMKYKEENIPLVVIAGKEYGTGSSRDWAAKGTYLLGVKAVIAESFERIHRSNLVGMGVLPLQFKEGESAKSLGLTGKEKYTITGIANGLTPRKELTIKADDKEFQVIARIDTPDEIEYYRHGGILQYVLRQIAGK